jgi:cell shape-determining protein MreC
MLVTRAYSELNKLEDEIERLRRKSRAHKRNIREMQAKLRLVTQENAHLKRLLDIPEKDIKIVYPRAVGGG